MNEHSELQKNEKPEHPDRIINIKIDRKHHQVQKAAMTGAELKKLGEVTPDYELWLERPGHEDLKIEDMDVVELKSGMKFFSVPPIINPGGNEHEFAR